jgi:hypothetical protein
MASQATICRMGNPDRRIAGTDSWHSTRRGRASAYPGSGVLTKPILSKPALAATAMTCATFS